MKALRADGGDGVGAQVLAAHRPGPVGRVDQRLIREREQLLAQRVVELASQVIGRDPQGR